MSLSVKTAAASLWMVGGRLLSKLIDFAALLILARYLGPADFGLVAIAMISVQIVDMILEIPAAAAIGSLERLTPNAVSTAFTIALLRALVIALLLALLAFPLAKFYGEPRLAGLLFVLALSPAMRGLSNPNLLVYSLKMDFRRDFAVDVLSKLIALLVSGIVAVLTGSYWALALNAVAATTSAAFISYLLGSRKVSLSLKEWRMFAPMMGWNSFAQIMQAVNWQLDRIVLPKFVSVASFGSYSNAANITSIPYQAIVQPVSRPLLVAFATGSDPERLRAGYLRASYTLTALVGPILIMISVCSLPIVEMVLGKAWINVAPILFYMAMTSAFTLPVIPMTALALSQGRANLISAKTFAELLVKTPAVLLLVSRFGIAGALWAQAFSSTAMVLSSMILVRRLIDLKLSRQLLQLFCPVASLALLGLIAHGVESVLYGRVHVLIVLVAAGVLGCSAYLVSMALFWVISGRPEGPEAMLWSRARKFLSRSRK